MMLAIESGNIQKNADGKDPIAVAMGRRGGLKGGKARTAAMTPEERKRWQQKRRRPDGIANRLGQYGLRPTGKRKQFIEQKLDEYLVQLGEELGADAIAFAGAIIFVDDAVVVASKNCSDQTAVAQNLQWF